MIYDNNKEVENKVTSNEDKNLKKMRILRKVKDIFMQVITYLFSSVGVVTLIAIFIFIFSRGWKSLSWDLISGDNISYTKVLSSETLTLTPLEADKEYEYYSANWGIAFEDTENVEGEAIVIISYVHEDSPVKNLTDSDGLKFSMTEGTILGVAQLVDESGADIYTTSKKGAEGYKNVFDKAVKIYSLDIHTKGGGIRGSLITTLYLILFTLLFALPLGIGAAIYLAVYAPKNKVTQTLRTMIDMISGIPSIIFGLVGAMIFIPIFDSMGVSDGGSILSGAATMAVMLLPTIIKTTEEAIHNIPESLRNASLALGATETQTTFKIILPNAIPGILTAVILSIGRVIGESAALIFAIGTVAKDTITLGGKSSTLAVHIWSLMQGETANYDTSCAISIIILFIVLLLNLLVKLVGKKLNKFEVR